MKKIIKTIYNKLYFFYKKNTFKIKNINSLKTWIKDKKHHWGDKNYSLEYFKILDKKTVTRQFPKSLQGNILPQFWMQNSYPEAFVATIPNAIIMPSGLLTTENRVIIGESVFNKNDIRKITKANIFHSTPTNLWGIYVTLLSKWSASGYFHWMFEVLPRIMLIEKAYGNTKHNFLLQAEAQASYQAESLKHIGINQNQIYRTNKDISYQAKNLIFPSLMDGIGLPREEYCHWLKSKFKTIETKKKNKIYISRKNSSRSIINEDELFSILAKKGFKKIQNEKLSLMEQIDLYANAEIVVAPHGAGLTNLVFCSPNTKVIELFHPNKINGCYWAISNAAKLDYYYYVGKDAKSYNTYIPKNDFQKLLDLANI